MEKQSLEDIFGTKTSSKPTLGDIFAPITKSKISGKEDILGDIRGIGTDIADNSFKRDAKIQEIRSAMESGEQGNVRSILQTSGQLAGAGADAIGAVAKGAFNALIPQTTEEAITQKIGGAVEKTKLPEVMQKYELLKQTNPVLARDIDAALGIASLGAEFIGLDVAKRGTNVVGQGIKRSAEEIAQNIDSVTTGVSKSTKLVGDLIQDVKPKSTDLRDRAVAKGLRLAPSDISTFKQVSGGTEDIGEFMSRNKLILDTSEETAQALVDFKKKNYELTRDAISLDDNIYTFNDIPELETTVDFLISDLSKTKSPEYQAVLSQLQGIKNKGEFDLLQAQYVKNVFDDIESVYKRTGEVRDAVMAQDKALSIQPVRRFIEDRVTENYPTINIGGLNKNVQLTSEILDSIAKRAPKADTASILKLGDYATLGIGNQVLPGAGFAALFTKKVVESAPVKLRFARVMARRAERQALKRGEVLKGLTPEQVDEMSNLVESELRKSIEMGDVGKSQTLQSVKDSIQSEKQITTTINKTAKNTSISDTIPQTSKKVKGETPSKLRKNSQAGFIATGFKNEGNLTTKILKDLEGKTTVSKQYILDATNRGELKQVERDITRQVLDTMKGDTINVKEFADKVKSELLPLEAKTSGSSIQRNKTSEDYLMTPRYENISLPSELRGKIKDYRERIYNSPIETSAGKTHFGSNARDTAKNYFGHTRIEDMADNQTRRVIEVQSDLYQKGNLEREVADRFDPVKTQLPKDRADKLFNYTKRLSGQGENLSTKEITEYRKLFDDAKTLHENTVVASRNKELSKLQQYNDPTAHFRMIREEIKKASQDGKTKLQFPTGETAMKIEGLGQVDNNWRNYTATPNMETPKKLSIENMNGGDEIVDGANQFWIITDVLGDGKFKAVPKDFAEQVKSFEEASVRRLEQGIDTPEQQARLRAQLAPREETFDISGKVDTSNPIYKFYEKDVQKYLNKFGGKKVVDDKGVSWIEIPITKEQGINPVDAFGKIQISPLYAGAGLSLAGVAGAGAIKKRKK